MTAAGLQVQASIFSGQFLQMCLTPEHSSAHLQMREMHLKCRGCIVDPKNASALAVEACSSIACCRVPWSAKDGMRLQQDLGKHAHSSALSRPNSSAGMGLLWLMGTGIVSRKAARGAWTLGPPNWCVALQKPCQLSVSRDM